MQRGYSISRKEELVSAYLKNFSEIPTYSDPGSQNQTCRDILPRGIVPDILVGYNILDGPGRTGLGNHPGWHQVFVVVKGQGTLLRGAERIPIQAPCVLHIPPNTDHDVLVEPGEHIEYVYLNKYLIPDK
jgi:mannose-6-phosphate isomerase-like protein (cupin superfamily)